MLAYALGQGGFHIPVTPTLVFASLAALIATWAIFTLIIRYHWKRYGTSRIQTFAMSFFYLAGSMVLLGGTTLAAIIYYVSSQ